MPYTAQFPIPARLEHILIKVHMNKIAMDMESWHLMSRTVFSAPTASINEES